MSAAQVSAAPAERPAWGAEGRDGPAEGARRREPGSPGGKEAAECGGRREPEPEERRRQAAAEAPPPKENPWTKRRAARDGAADGQLVLREPGAGRGGGPGGRGAGRRRASLSVLRKHRVCRGERVPSLLRRLRFPPRRTRPAPRARASTYMGRAAAGGSGGCCGRRRPGTAS